MKYNKSKAFKCKMMKLKRKRKENKTKNKSEHKQNKKKNQDQKMKNNNNLVQTCSSIYDKHLLLCVARKISDVLVVMER